MNAITPFEPIPLTQRLVQNASAWAAAHDATLARLGRMVINDGGFFARLESAGASTTTATLEKFARFLVEPDNWPAGAVPDEVCRFAHAVGISGGACGVSPDIGGEIIAPQTLSALRDAPDGAPQDDRNNSDELEGTGRAQLAGASGRTPALRQAQDERVDAAGAFAAPEPGKGLPASAGSGVADEYWPEAPE